MNPRPGDLGRLAHVLEARVLDDRRRDLARIAAQALGQAHRGVGLKIAELRILRRAHERIDVGELGAEGRDDRLDESLCKKINGVNAHAAAV